MPHPSKVHNDTCLHELCWSLGCSKVSPSAIFHGVVHLGGSLLKVQAWKVSVA